MLRPGDLRRPWRASTSPTTSCTAWRSGERLPRARPRRRAPSPRPPRPPACSASSTSAVSATPPPTSRGTCARARRPATALREAGVPVTEFRAAVVVGSGQHLLRDDPLPDRASAGHDLPAMGLHPRAADRHRRTAATTWWRRSTCRTSAGRVVEIGGADVLTYGEMMLGYAQARGLRRRLQPVPVLTPKLSSYWVHLVTPIPSHDRAPADRGPAQRGRSCATTRRARPVPRRSTRWAMRRPSAPPLAQPGHGRGRDALDDALVTSGGDVQPRAADHAGGHAHRAPPGAGGGDAGETSSRVFVSHRRRSAATAALNWAWQLRGAVDRLVGGVGPAPRPPRPRRRCASATRSTSGASRRWSPDACCACAPR